MYIKEFQKNNERFNNEKDFGNLSDGSHTFNDLYNHRAALFAIIIKDNPDISWKSKLHYDGTMYDGYFICGINLPYTDGPITYHYKLDKWDLFDCKEIDRSPKYDGANPDDNINRAIQYINYKQ